MTQDSKAPEIGPIALADMLEEEVALQSGRAARTGDLPLEGEPARLAAVYERIRAEFPKRSAICLSGGGIRSAAFCDGVLQALVRLDLFRQLDYISTVGTGGLVGGWAVIGQSRLQRSGGKSFPAVEINHALNPTGEEGWNRRWVFFKNVLISSIVILSCLTAMSMALRFLTALVVLPPFYNEQWVKFGIFVVACVSISVISAGAVISGRLSLSKEALRQRFLSLNILPSFTAAIALTSVWAAVYNPGWNVVVLSVAVLLSCAFIVGGVGGLLISKFLRNPERGFRARRPIESFRAALRPMFAACLAFFATGMVLTKVFPDPARYPYAYVCFGTPLLIVAIMLVGELTHRDLRPHVEDEERPYSIPGWTVVIVVAWFVSYGASYVTSFLLFYLPRLAPTAAGLLIGFMFCGLAAGVIVARVGFSASTSVLWNIGFIGILLSIGAVFFFLALWALVNVGLDIIISPFVFFSLRNDDTGMGPGFQRWWWYCTKIAIVTVLAVIGVCAGFLVDINRLSLQAIYRDSLRRILRNLQRNYFSSANGNTRAGETAAASITSGGANFPIAQLAEQRPFLVINAAVRFPGPQASASGQQIAPFTITPTHCGSASIGYRPSDYYGGGIKLDTALSISGTVPSPSIGYHGSRLVSAVMTLLNVRLCWWQGNPGDQGSRTWRLLHPRHMLGPLLAELFFGQLTAQTNWINLINGGRWDNLGLYEMILRRCRFIIVVDATPDLEYTNEEFANTIHKVGSILNIPIEIDLPRSGRGADNFNPHVTVGRISYSTVDGPDAADGLLLYIRPVVSGDEPTTVQSYAAANPVYPNEVGRERALTAAMLENYQLLGAHSIQTFASGKSGSIPELFQQARLYTQPAAPATTERSIIGLESRDTADRHIASSRAAKGLNKIFISYRREDTPDAAGRIYDRLLRDFSSEYVFKDVDSIPYGLDFPNYLAGVIEQCAVCLVIIGRSWLSVTNEQGMRRLDSPDDFVRIEVESALKRDIPVIPLLVQNAQMPKASELPESLSGLCRRNGTPIQGDPNFHSDMDRLINRLKKDLQLESRTGS
jgi:hypothetical protein